MFNVTLIDWFRSNKLQELEQLGFSSNACKVFVTQKPHPNTAERTKASETGM